MAPPSFAEGITFVEGNIFGAIVTVVAGIDGLAVGIGRSSGGTGGAVVGNNSHSHQLHLVWCLVRCRRGHRCRGSGHRGGGPAFGEDSGTVVGEGGGAVVGTTAGASVEAAFGAPVGTGFGASVGTGVP